LILNITIDKALGIKYEEKQGYWIAEPTTFTGTPVCGHGSTKDEARYDLLAQVIWQLSGQYVRGSDGWHSLAWIIQRKRESLEKIDETLTGLRGDHGYLPIVKIR